jgi:hypothetical protein
MVSLLQFLVLPSIVLSHNQDRVTSGCLCMNMLVHALNKLIFLLYIPVNGIPVSSSTVRSQILLEPLSPLCTFRVDLSWNHLPFITVACFFCLALTFAQLSHTCSIASKTKLIGKPGDEVLPGVRVWCHCPRRGRGLSYRMGVVPSPLLTKSQMGLMN